MNEHEAVRNLLALAVSGALDPQEQLRVERHTHECAACREEMETWTVLAGGVRSMPQPAAPEYLAERTQQKVLGERKMRAERRHTGLLLAALSLFGWSVSLAFWLLLRVSMGDSMVILQVDLLRPDLWALLGTLLVWASGATAAVVLARSRQEWRTAL
jgi:anti-sigma factor RsiW